jgi:hypothetical protein
VPPLLVVHATEVAPVPGVDLDLLAGGEEQRDLDLGAGLQRGRLGATRGAVALQARVGVRDDQLDAGGQLDVEAASSCIATIASMFSRR